jgi:DNA-binding response OmpR family regulator
MAATGRAIECGQTAVMRSSGHPPHPEGEREPASRGRILIVEDDPDTALFITYVLTSRGQFDVTHTADPAVALELAVAEPWDFVLTDLDLPVMSGRELVVALRRVAPGLRVVLMSAVAPGAYPATRGSANCPDTILAKPVTADHLLATVSAVMSGSDPRPQAPHRPIEDQSPS